MREERDLFNFFIIAYLFTWIINVPLALSSHGLIPMTLNPNLLWVASYGPLISALILTTSKGDSIKRFLVDNLKPRVPPRWFLFALFSSGAIGAFSVYLSSFIKGTAPDFMWAPGLQAFPLIFVIVFIVGGPLGEEYGWRGYALPRLVQKYGVFKANLVLGALWGLWHLPLFFTSGSVQSEIPFLGYMAQAMGTTFIYTWMYRQTGSIFLSMVFHSAGNSFAALIPFLPLQVTGGTLLTFSIFLAILWVVAGVIIFTEKKE